MPSPLGAPGSAEHMAFVRDVEERMRFYRDQRQQIIRDTLDRWDLYLTQKKEFRQKGEEWRANMALPDAFASVEAKVANLVAIMLGADPLIQTEGTSDTTSETAKSVERLLDYTYRKNAFPKWLTKLLRSRSVAGTAFYKLTWVEQSHMVTLSRDMSAVMAFQAQVDMASHNPGLPPAPNWMTDPDNFEKWRQLINDSKRGEIPAPPLDGPQKIVRYRGPKLHLLPLTSVYLDPMVDEMCEQNFIVHRVVKPLAWLEERTKAGMYDAAAVKDALEGWDGQRMEQEEVDLALKMGLTTDASGASDPQYQKAVELWECWQPGTPLPYTLILNRKAVINLKPTEMPFLHGQPTIGATRSVVLPGHFYGISDLTPPADLFWEKRKLRNLRVDAVTMNVLPAYTKLKEVGLPEMMHQIRPGALIPVSREGAIMPLHKEPLPPEAYREPEDMDIGIADSMGVFASTKGRDAAIGRVTGTEFQGRENRAQIRFKLDSTFLEEDLHELNPQIISMFAQLGDDPMVVRAGGAPNPIIGISRTDLMEAMEMQWRFRGPNKAINKDMQVQHLLMWVKAFGVQLTPQEYRYTARQILDLLDIRGAGMMVSAEGTQQKTAEYQMAAQLQSAQAKGAGREQGINNERVPPELGALAGGEGGGQPPPQEAQ